MRGKVEAFSLCAAAEGGSGILSICQMKTVAAEETISPSIVADHKAIELAAAIIGGTKGDVNADGSIDMTDALIVMRTALDRSELGAYAGYCADMNNNGTADIQDALSIMRKALA
ncbi:MAG: dockerin type I repeat-containing protein [Clostridia bacterium]|nr:dockerin type I repeat-containing protein [Clostridia bacterium]